MCLFLSLQLTASSNLTMSHIQGSSGIAFKSAPRVSVHVACMFLCEWTCVRGRAGNGRVKSWQRAVAPTPSACFATVSACLISVLKSGSQWDLCLRSGSDTVVLSTLFQVRCVHWELSGHMLSWLDFSWETEAPLQALLPQQVTFWGIRACLSYRMTSFTVSALSRHLVNLITYVQRCCLSHWIYPTLLLKPVIVSTLWFLHILQ